MRGTIITISCSGACSTTTPIDGPPTPDRLRTAIGGGEVENVPGFDTIDYAGKIVPCVAFCDIERQLKNLPINRDATILWDAALLRAGYPGLLKAGGQIADMLRGQVAVVFGDEEFMAVPALSRLDGNAARQ